MGVMTEIYTYSVAILVGVGVFGAILGLMRLLHTRRLGLAQGVIQNLETIALRDLEKKDLPEKELREGEPFAARPSLFGIPYVAWISTSLFIPSAFLILFFANWARVSPGQLLGALLIPERLYFHSALPHQHPLSHWHREK